jgi:23S rRNA (guanosine2251-2'-O)-methyltransferase
MVGKSRKHRQKRLAGNHQKCWIWGRNAVLQTLEAGRWRPLQLVLSDRLTPHVRQQVDQLAAGLAIPVETADSSELTARCRSEEHQGLMAMMPPFPYERLADVALPIDHPALVLMLEGIQDPHNFGAILRSAEILGVDFVIVGERLQCEVTPHVARASAGAVNDVRLVREPELVSAAAWLKQNFMQVLGTSGHSDVEIDSVDLARPTAIVIGNEGAGLSDELAASCHSLVRIPQSGRTESLNAAVAAGILCYEAQRQRRSKSTFTS